ncbi:MAG: o-succinylbenzoate synthase [Chloroflexota bacterium]|nr:o-succinylbenzoate synthase [Chloroflexota bacterium]
MRLERLEIRHVRLPLVTPFETSLGRLLTKDAVILRGEAEGLVGWGEVAAWSDPWYSYETVQTSLYVLTRYLVPLALRAEVADAATTPDPWPTIRGYPMAKAALQCVALDLLAQERGQSLADWLGGQRSEVPVGISLGIEGSIDRLLERIGTAQEAGYQRVKLKIRPGWDIAVLRAVRERFGDSLQIAGDANGAYCLEDADHLAQVDAFGLSMLEQPLQHDDIDDHAELARQIATPICLDESLPTLGTARQALATRACRVVNIKPGRVGGIVVAQQLHNLCAAAGVPVFCGGMLETGIGRAANVALASLANFTIPGDLSASDRYFHRDLIAPPFVLLDGGLLKVPTGPGLGVAVDQEALEAVTVRRRKLNGAPP